MKTLIIIVSIILLSYQIDRFFTKDKAIAPVAIQMNHAGEFRQEADEAEAVVFTEEEAAIEVEEPELIKEAASPAYDAYEMVPASNETAVAAVAHTVAKESSISTKYRLKQASKINQHAKIFHSRLKESGTYLSLNSVQFNHNQFDVLGSEDFNTVMHYADLLIFDENLKVSVAGFADITGDAAYNEQLSLMRAIHVQNYLVDLGVNEEQIVVSAYGIESPVGDNATKEGRALNRRVELALIAE